MNLELLDLFVKCVQIPYLNVGHDVNYAFLREKDVLYLFFESSDGIADWKRNFDFPAKPYKRMGKTVWFAHSGFLNAWKRLEPQLAPLILDRRLKKTVVVGYSHGAAIAVLCHEYIWYARADLRRESEGYGFGCPRVFWGLLTPSLAKRWEHFTVIRNLDDLVTHLPPALLGYRHVGTVMKIGARGRYSMIDAHRPKNIQKELKELSYPKKVPLKQNQNSSIDTAFARGSSEVNTNSLSPATRAISR